MRTISIFFLAVLLLAPMSINAAESGETEETMEALPNDVTGTWSAINSGLTNTHVYTLAIAPSNPSIIYAGTDDGVFKTTDGGGSWSAINSGLPKSTVNALAIDPSNPDIVYASTSTVGIYLTTNGEGWSVIRPPEDITNYALVIDPSDPSIFYVSNNAEGGGVYKFTGWGSNWNGTCLVSVDWYPNGLAYALAIDPTNHNIIYSGTNVGVFKTTDGGVTCSAINSGLTNVSVYALAIDPSNTSIIYAGTDGGVFKSTNGGATWSAINSGLTNFTVNTAAIDPSNTTFIYAGTEGGVFESTNGGDSWSAINSGLTNTHVTSLAIDPSNTGIIYAGTLGGGVFKSSPAEGPPSLHVSKSGTGDGRVTSNPSGIDCGSTCTGTYSQGTPVTLTALADAGSAFTGWSGGGCSRTGTCTITLNSDTTITASFALSGNCAYTISPANKTFNARGGSVSIKVSATGQTNCPAPLINENAEWISSGTPTWKANKGTVKIAVQQNPNSQSRTGVVSIGGEDLTIGEAGAICQLTALKPSSGKYPSTGGSESFDITVSPQDCGWNVATTFDWIHLDTTTGTGNGTAAFHLDANGTGKNRTGKINVSLAQNPTKKKTFTVNESK